ncbi:MAG: hypothetical protein JWL69_819 [Phycisphaerales bacterium]|nr:hypothetical protein [Phycisphaerales bacterium]MDB5354573.1 hypothetical protein [Phycisphaerales bacterium]
MTQRRPGSFSWIGLASLALVLHCALSRAADPPQDDIAILPRDFTLAGPVARQTLLVEKLHDGRAIGEAEDVSFTSSDPNILKIHGKTAIPVGNGKATLTATSGDRSASATVTVTAFDKPTIPSFRNDIQPILMAGGCSSGACHGAAAGKNGFKLSLRGYDDEGDWRALTRHAMGRRIDPSDPGRSLMLLKPTAAVPHKGGERIKPGSIEYSLLAEWIASGAPGPRANDPRIVNIEIVPPIVTLARGAQQQLVVLAHFSDGRVQDVTRWAKYTAADTSVATVDDTGKVKVAGRGEAPIVAWYLSRLTTATVTVPFEACDPALFASAPRRNFIDDLVLEKLKSLNLPPSVRSSNGEILRRAFLDTIGVLPTADETRAFLADNSPDKRDRLIESLLNRPEFVDYWAYRWSDLLLVSSRSLRPAGMRAYYAWVRQQVADNTSWDQFARRVVTATGSTLENGAANFYLLHDDPSKSAETVSVAFLGMSVNCAKCHNHPLEKWTNNQYFAFANLFSRVRTKNASGEGNFVVFAAADGELIQPLTGKPQPPAPLDGPSIAFDDPTDRRVHAADWLVSRDNPYFARAVVNRVWANYLGVGLVESVDDMRKTNPASNEALLAALSNYLADQKFDLKSLMRLILQSETYQRSSQSTGANGADKRFYSHYYTKRLMAEVTLDALSQVTSVSTPFNGYPLGTRAVQLPDSNVDSYFLKAFGRPDRMITCACERTEQPSVAQTLHIANGDTINPKLQAKGSRVEHWVAANAPDEKIVEELYLSALSRYPTDDEKKRVMAALGEPKDQNRREVIEDLYWGVLSSNSFLFNH